MKVYPDKLAATLSRGLSPLYMISGDDPLLVQESCDLLRNTLRKSGFSEREVHHVDAKFDWDEVLYSANSMSLFSEQKLIELRMLKDKPGDAGVKALQSYLADPSPDTCILMVMPKLEQSTQRTKWFASLLAAGVLVQVWPIDRDRMPAWINNRMRAAGLQADREAVEILIDRIEGNLLAASQEIERLALLSPDGQVDADLVVESVSDSTRYDVFGMIDTALGQQAEKAVRMLRGLQSEGAEPVSVSNLIGRELRSLTGMAELIARGQSIDGVIKQFRVWPKRKPVVGRCLQAQNLRVLLDCHKQVAKVDRMAKGMAKGNPWDALESILMKLAGKPVHG